MHSVAFQAIVFVLTVTSAQSYPRATPNTLNPVHGLFVKPSGDGTTGDLYVAATEDHGIKSQWVADQPISFLPVGAATQAHATTVPLPYPPAIPSSHEDGATQKRAIMPTPLPFSPIQYAYAMPLPPNVPSEGTPFAPYPYSFPVPPSPTESSTPKCDTATNYPHYPFQFPFNFFYPHMMSAYTNAMSILKDVGLSEDTASSVMANTTPMWPPASYAYPMYVMVDPNAWAQSQDSVPYSTPGTPNSASNESS